MFSLKHKLLAGFAGLLAVAILVSTIGINVINSYARALQQVLRENYNSMVYSEGMQVALQQMNDGLQRSLWHDFDQGLEDVQQGIRDFERDLEKERGNITLPGEADSVNSLSAGWDQLLREYPLMFRVSLSDSARREFYGNHLQLQIARVHDITQHISDMNLSNMVAVDGQAQLQAREAKSITYILIAAGLLLALVLIYVTGRSILQPLSLLTQSIREIQQGNLNLVLQPRYRDEVGQLMEAFNDMAAQLRELKRGDQARLVRSQQSAQLVLESLPDAVVVMAPDATVELANQAARKILGVYPGGSVYDASESWMKSIRLNEPHRPSENREGESPKVVQVFVDGQERFFMPRVIPIQQEGGIVGLILVFMDVTRLRRISEMENDLISTVSHELKTPLTSVRMALHLMMDDRVGGLNAKQSELLTAARDDAERLFAIVNDLLEIARYEGGRAALDLARVSPQHLVNDAAERFHTAYQSAGVELRSELDEDLPDVLANRQRIAHVFDNLLSNALRFSSPGNHVMLTARADENQVVFSVADQGPGIPTEDLSRVFEKFYRGRSQEKSEGAGLGLAIAKEIVDAHGGTIGVKSHPGEGATFEFTLKRADTSDA